MGGGERDAARCEWHEVIGGGADGKPVHRSLDDDGARAGVQSPHRVTV